MFYDETKNICTCTFVSMILVLLFIVSPLSNFFKTSFLMKIIALAIVGYICLMTLKQLTYLNNLVNTSDIPEIIHQLNINITCSYVFILFIGLLFIFIVKSFF